MGRGYSLLSAGTRMAHYGMSLYSDMPGKLIEEIRCFESSDLNADGEPMPQEVGVIFAFPETSNAVCLRVAEKLNGYGLSLGSITRLYLNFTTRERPGETGISSRTTEPEIAFVDIGLDPEWVRGLSNDEKKECLEGLALHCLRHFVDDDESLRIIERVKKEL